MNEAQIKHMVNRFLNWKLPEHFRPDAGISFKAEYNENTPWPMKHEPTGTNLLDATQADAMVRHMLDGLPLAAKTTEQSQCKFISGIRLPGEKLPKVSVGYRTDDSDRVPADAEKSENDKER
jgi:hypothetical protein